MFELDLNILSCVFLDFSDCVSLQSPYCAWHKRESKCVTIPLDRPISRRYYIQNVSTGNHTDCPKLTNSIISNSIPSEQHKSTSKAIDSSGSQTINILSDNGQSNKEVINVCYEHKNLSRNVLAVPTLADRPYILN